MNGRSSPGRRGWLDASPRSRPGPFDVGVSDWGSLLWTRNLTRCRLRAHNLEPAGGSADGRRLAQMRPSWLVSRFLHSARTKRHANLCPRQRRRRQTWTLKNVNCVSRRWFGGWLVAVWCPPAATPITGSDEPGAFAPSSAWKPWMRRPLRVAPPRHRSNPPTTARTPQHRQSQSQAEPSKSSSSVLASESAELQNPWFAAATTASWGRPPRMQHPGTDEAHLAVLIRTFTTESPPRQRKRGRLAAAGHAVMR